MMDDTKKNQIMAIVMSLAVLLGWQYFFALPKDQERRRQAQLQQTSAAALPSESGKTAAPAADGSIPSAAGVATEGGAAGLSRDAALALSPRVAITTPDLIGSVSLKGGRIDDLVLAQYKETTAPDSPKVVLFEPAGAKESYFADFGWVAAAGQTVAVPNRSTVWTQQGQGSLTPTTPLVMTYDNGQGQVFRRTVSVDSMYMFTIKDTVDNAGAASIVLQPYGKIFRLGTPKTSGYAVLHEGLIGVLSADASPGLQEVAYSKLAAEATSREKEKKSAVGEIAFPGVRDGWIGFTDKYWAAVLIPPVAVPYDAHMLGYKSVPGTQDEGFQTDYLLAPLTVAPGGTQSSEQRLFAGAKQVRLLNAYAATGIKRFDLMIDWGWFHFVAKPMFWLIEKLYGLLGNFGLAILAVTVLAKGAFFPLASKSYESMAKMKKMQPEMERIKALYKDDRERQQKETMKLYSEHKINPVSGCLPMLLQFPVFFALYKVLVLTIDMRQAPFFGWIHDLSAPDPSNVFNLFGLLPFDPTQVPVLGHYLHMGFWPLIMGVTMWMTMQLNPQQADPTQQQIMNWMPVIFTFTMSAFPAGLVIYWAWNNTLSLCQQYFIMHKNGADIHLWKNIGVDKWFDRVRGNRTD